ncbi:TnsA endonuclease N-terminal domain-containing protein [Geobacter anodireducens]
MSKKFVISTEADIERRISKGFGLGEGVNYIPWIRKHDFGSLGTAKELFGVKIQRSHHLLSQLEYKVFLPFERSPHVLDIREQFPLLDRDLVARIVSQMGCRPPYYPGTKILYVLTTDLLLTIQTVTGPRLFAIAIKPSEALQKIRVRELLEIEHRYWAAYGVPWMVVTDRDTSRNHWLNLRWLRQSATLHSKLSNPDLQAEFLTILPATASNDTLLLRDILSITATRLGIATEESVALYKFHTWHGSIDIDLSERIELTKCIKGFTIPASPIPIPFIGESLQ